ncbi:MAG: LytR family transcriptional regulator [Micromonosporaceae bacterium]|nr:LytR family transcriptional regulator [Micromonosporaceae bacterium]
MTLARVRALLVVVTMAALAASFVLWAILRDSQAKDDPAEQNCPQGAVPAATAVPEPKNMKLNVYNDTDQRGLAKRVAGQLKSRGFKIGKVGNDPDPDPVKGTALLRFGPDGLGGAHLLRAYFVDADSEPDTRRKGASIDIVLGQQFKQLSTPSEVNDGLRLLGDPSPPAGMC